MKNRYSELPAPFNLNGPLLVPYTTSFFLIHHECEKLATEDGTKLLLKLVTLEGDAKLHIDDIKRLAHGIVYKIDYGKNFRDGSKAFHLMLLKLGGWQARYHHLVPAGAPKASKDREACNNGFRFIAEAAKRLRSNAHNEQTEFAEIETNDPDSVLFGWSAGLVKESLRNHAKGANLARVIQYYPLTLADIVGWLFDLIVLRVLALMETHGIIWLGTAGRGKTAVMSILSMLWSLLHILEQGLEGVDPSFRTSNSFDGFRGEDGTKTRPCQYDDGTLEKEGPAKLKAYLDITGEDASLEQR